MDPLHIIFMGTAPLAQTCLKGLNTEVKFSIDAVVTQPDRPKGRSLKLEPSAVKQLALELNLPVLQPERARNEDFIQQLRTLNPDVIAVAAYGQILPKAILEIPRLGCLNVHASLLPKYRGAAPIQWAILNDEPETGVTIMLMDEGLDTGAILTQEKAPIAPEDDASTLHDRLGLMGAELLVETIRARAAGKTFAKPQPTEGVSIARKITKEDGLIDWSLPARTIRNRIRAFRPWPGAFTHLPGTPPRLLKIWQADVVEASGEPGAILHSGKEGIVVACGQQALCILALQPEGRRAMAAADFLAGHSLPTGTKFIGKL